MGLVLTDTTITTINRKHVLYEIIGTDTDKTTSFKIPRSARLLMAFQPWHQLVEGQSYFHTSDLRSAMISESTSLTANISS